MTFKVYLEVKFRVNLGFKKLDLGTVKEMFGPLPVPPEAMLFAHTIAEHVKLNDRGIKLTVIVNE